MNGEIAPARGLAGYGARLPAVVGSWVIREVGCALALWSLANA